VGDLLDKADPAKDVLLRFRGFTGSYSHGRLRSKHRSHEGRFSLHFFFCETCQTGDDSMQRSFAIPLIYFTSISHVQEEFWVKTLTSLCSLSR
jgi:hypothetical protein